MIEDLEPAAHQSPKAVLTLEYEVSKNNDFAPAIRSLGVALMLLALLGLLRNGIYLFMVSRSYSTLVAIKDYLTYFMCSMVAVVVVFILQMIAGIGCLRLRPSARRWLSVWACVSLICTTGISAMGMFFVLRQGGSVLPTTQAHNALIYAESLLIGIIVPIFALIMSRSSAFAEALRRQPESKRKPASRVLFS